MTDRVSETIADRLAIACAQLDPLAGDPAANLELARRARADAARDGADILLLSELFVSGHAPGAALTRHSFVEACRVAVEALACETADGGPAILLGTPWIDGGRICDAACLLDGGRVEAIRCAVVPPRLDGAAAFAAGPLPGPFRFRGIGLGVAVGEGDATEEVVECLDETGAEILIVLAGAPWRRDSHDRRANLAAARIAESGLPLVFLNRTGGEAGCVFDGASFGLGADHSPAFRLPAFEAAVATTRWERRPRGWACVEGPSTLVEEGDALLWRPLVGGVRDHVGKSGDRGALVDLDGTPGAAICAMLAVDALGAGQVRCVMAPGTGGDAAAWLRGLGVRCDEIAIAGPAAAFDAAVGDLAAEGQGGGGGEGGAPALRGALLLALAGRLGVTRLDGANRTDRLLGRVAPDGPCVGFRPLRDVHAGETARLAAYRAAERPAGCLGPQRDPAFAAVFGAAERAARAENAANEIDRDVLPPYEVLDEVLKGLAEAGRSVAERTGVAEARVRAVADRLERRERADLRHAPGIALAARDNGRG